MSEEKNIPLPKLNPATEKVIKHCITEVLEEYTDQTKYFTADTLHNIRVQITKRVHDILGDEDIENIDVILDLSALDPIPFGFRIRVPKEKAEEHILKSTVLENES